MYNSFLPHSVDKEASFTAYKIKINHLTGQLERSIPDSQESSVPCTLLAHSYPQLNLCLQTDASDLGFDAVLFQKREGGGRDRIEYAGHKLASILHSNYIQY